MRPGIPSHRVHTVAGEVTTVRGTHPPVHEGALPPVHGHGFSDINVGPSSHHPQQINAQLLAPPSTRTSSNLPATANEFRALARHIQDATPPLTRDQLKNINLHVENSYSQIGRAGKFFGRDRAAAYRELSSQISTAYTEAILRETTGFPGGSVGIVSTLRGFTRHLDHSPVNRDTVERLEQFKAAADSIYANRGWTLFPGERNQAYKDFSRMIDGRLAGVREREKHAAIEAAKAPFENAALIIADDESHSSRDLKKLLKSLEATHAALVRHGVENAGEYNRLVTGIEDKLGEARLREARVVEKNASALFRNPGLVESGAIGALRDVLAENDSVRDSMQAFSLTLRNPQRGSIGDAYMNVAESLQAAEMDSTHRASILRELNRLAEPRRTEEVNQTLKETNRLLGDGVVLSEQTQEHLRTAFQDDAVRNAMNRLHATLYPRGTDEQIGEALAAVNQAAGGAQLNKGLPRDATHRVLDIATSLMEPVTGSRNAQWNTDTLNYGDYTGREPTDRSRRAHADFMDAIIKEDHTSVVHGKIDAAIRDTISKQIAAGNAASGKLGYGDLNWTPGGGRVAGTLLVAAKWVGASSSHGDDEPIKGKRALAVMRGDRVAIEAVDLEPRFRAVGPLREEQRRHVFDLIAAVTRDIENGRETEFDRSPTFQSLQQSGIRGERLELVRQAAILAAQDMHDTAARVFDRVVRPVAP